MTDRRAAWRRRSLSEIVGENIRREAQRIAAEQAIPDHEAVSAVFADQALLDRCHQVAGRPLPDMPRSSIEAQNG